MNSPWRFRAVLRAFFRRCHTRYELPADVRAALERIFDEPEIGAVQIRYRPIYVRLHLACIGGRFGSVTRRRRIYTNFPPEAFFALDEHLLHEFYHVVQQWGREGMTRTGYLLCARRREREACRFAAENVEAFVRLRRWHASCSDSLRTTE